MFRPRGPEYRLIQLAIDFLKQTRPSSCVNAASLFEDPLFRGVIRGFDVEYGVTEVTIRQTISEILGNIVASAPPESQSNYAALHQILFRFNPDDPRTDAWQIWTECQLASLDQRTNDIGTVLGQAMRRVNTRAMEND